MKQSEIRQKVITAIYDYRMYSNIEGLSLDPEQILSDVFECDYKDTPLFARELFVKSLRTEAEAIKAIEPHLNRWTFSRLNAVIQALLIASYTERNIIKETDKKVVINEAVTYAKDYADNLDYRFVNAVLDKVLN